MEPYKKIEIHIEFFGFEDNSKLQVEFREVSVNARPGELYTENFSFVGTRRHCIEQAFLKLGQVGRLKFTLESERKS